MNELQTDPQPDVLALAPELTSSRGIARRLSINAGVSLLRVGVNAGVALLLPAFLTHRLSPEVYGAWVIILQMGAYISFLDFGVQTGIAKFVAEYCATGDQESAAEISSAGLAMLLAASCLGLLLTLVVAWQVPRLFAQMPPSLFSQVRLSIVIVGSSLCVNLVSSAYAAIFLGLQRYFVPTSVAIANRLLSSGAIVLAVSSSKTLITMSIAMAAVNLITALFQIAAWHRWAREVDISLKLLRRKALIRVLKYSALMAVWTASSLCVSGLDLTIIGHYAFHDAPYYSLATLPTNLLILVLSSAMAPFMPAASALSTQRSSSEMGSILERTTCYTALLLCLVGLPLIVFGQTFLRIWVGPDYAANGIRMLQVLVVATIIRNLCLPYSVMVFAIGKQRFGTVATVAEAIVNLSLSLFLVRRFGGLGVAAGTLVGAIVSVSMHFFISMRYTHADFFLPRLRLLSSGMLRPLVATLPTILLISVWMKPHPLMPLIAALWILSTLTLLLCVGLDAKTRNQLWSFLLRRTARLV